MRTGRRHANTRGPGAVQALTPSAGQEGRTSARMPPGLGDPCSGDFCAPSIWASLRARPLCLPQSSGGCRGDGFLGVLGQHWAMET